MDDPPALTLQRSTRSPACGAECLAKDEANARIYELAMRPWGDAEQPENRVCSTNSLGT